jgi:hypothetical protein
MVMVVPHNQIADAANAGNVPHGLLGFLTGPNAEMQFPQRS